MIKTNAIVKSILESGVLHLSIKYPYFTVYCL